MITNQLIRTILPCVVGLIVSCISINSFASNPTSNNCLYTSLSEHTVQGIDELKVAHEESVFVNVPVNFSIESPHSLVKVFLYVDGVYAGGIIANSNYINMEMKFSNGGVKQLKFVGVKDEEGQYLTSVSYIRIIDPETNKQQVNYNQADIVFRPAAERRKIAEESTNYATRKTAAFTTNNNFINDIIQLVQKHLENQNIVLPIHVIVAMATFESGYGKSELALNANNFFGLKSCHSKPNDPNVYLYIRQPAEDCNLYRKFDDREACISFFIDELLLNRTGQWRRNYSPVAHQYQDEINQGIDKITATEHFIEGLMEKGYSTNNSYKNGVMRLINNYHLLNLE